MNACTCGHGDLAAHFHMTPCPIKVAHLTRVRMSNYPHPGAKWLGKRVRVYSGVDRAKEYHPMVEGEVVAYIEGPSITVRASDGHQSTWPVSLPIDAWDPPKLARPSEESRDLARRLLNGILTVDEMARTIDAARGESS